MSTPDRRAHKPWCRWLPDPLRASDLDCTCERRGGRDRREHWSGIGMNMRVPMDERTRADRRAERAAPRGPLEAQVHEALAIIEDGTDYERIHVAAILQNGLRAALAESDALAKDPGPLGSAVCALRHAADGEAEGGVTIYPQEASALLARLRTAERAEPSVEGGGITTPQQADAITALWDDVHAPGRWDPAGKRGALAAIHFLRARLRHEGEAETVERLREVGLTLFGYCNHAKDCAVDRLGILGCDCGWRELAEGAYKILHVPTEEDNG